MLFKNQSFLRKMNYFYKKLHSAVSSAKQLVMFTYINIIIYFFLNNFCCLHRDTSIDLSLLI